MDLIYFFKMKLRYHWLCHFQDFLQSLQIHQVLLEIKNMLLFALFLR